MVMGPRIVLTADTKQAVAAISSFQMHAQHAIAGVNTAANVGAMGLKVLGAAFIGVGAAAMVTYGAVSSFNASLVHVRALGNLTQQEMNTLADSVNRVSVAYGVSGDVIADGTVILAKAGLTVEEINSSIGAMTALSKANAISFEEAANMTVFAVETFHKEYGDVNDILDKMQVAAQQSILDIGDLQKAFAYAGSTAMMTGVSYEELLAIMATLSNRALEAGISARSTNKMLLDIVQHAPELEAFYKKMGKNFDIISDGTIQFSELVAALSDATINVEFLQGATDIFTVRALRAFGLLAGASDDYAEMLGAVHSAQGELARTVDVQLTSLSARMEMLKLDMIAMLRSPEVMAGLDMMVSSFELLAEKLIPEFTAAMVHATQAFAGMMKDDAITNLIGSLVTILLNFLKVSANLVRVLTAFDGKLIGLLITMKMFQVLTVKFATRMFFLADAWMANLLAQQKFDHQMKLTMDTETMLSMETNMLGMSIMSNSLLVDKAKHAYNELRREKGAVAIQTMTLAQAEHDLNTIFKNTKMSTTELEAAMKWLSAALSLTKAEMNQLGFAATKGQMDLQKLKLQAQKVSMGFQMVAASIGNAVSMGMMMATMDFSPMMKNLIMVSAIMNSIAMAATIYAMMVAAGRDAVWAGVGAVGSAIAMGAVAMATYSEMGKMYSSGNLGTRYSDLQESYTADTGMFVGGTRRSVYDEGGVAPRHQLVYVEPGEQIISKTQGMVGMGGGGVNVYVGDVYAQDGTDFADKLADALPRAMQRASYRGTF